MSFSKKALSFISFLTVFCISSAFALVINVPEDHDSIQGAINASVDGDTVLVAQGEYPGDIDFDGKAILVLSSEGPLVTIINGRGAVRCVAFLSGEDENSILEGFTLTNGVATGQGYGGGILIEGSSPIVKNNIFFGNLAAQGGGGISVSGDGANPLIFRNLFYNNETPEIGGAVSIYQCGSRLINNTIVNNSAGRDGAAIGLPFANGVQITNNIVTENPSGQGGAISGWNAQNIILTYNDVWNNNGGDYGNNVEAGEGSISADPLFENPDERDYHLTEDSPCIDAGDPDSPPDEDGSRADIGAYPRLQEQGEDLPDIHIEPDHIDFWVFDTGAIDSIAVTISNVGNAILSVTSQIIVPDHAVFSVGMGGEEFDLEVDSSHTTWIVFSPVDEGWFEAFYRIGSNAPRDMIDIPITGSALTVEQNNDQLPATFNIQSIYPNPFNSTAVVTYNIPTSTPVSITLHDLHGRAIRQLVNRVQTAGTHSIAISSDALTTGVYLLRAEVSGQVDVRKVVLVE